jgi:hypothetical protein
MGRSAPKGNKQGNKAVAVAVAAAAAANDD